MSAGRGCDQAYKTERDEVMKPEYKNKAEFINNLCDLLRTDLRSSVDLLHYEIRSFDGYEDEIVHVCYTGGHHETILVTNYTIGMIAKEVINEVYK